MSKKDIQRIYNLHKIQHMGVRAISDFKDIKYNHRRIKKLL